MPSFSLFNEILIKLKKKVYLSVAPNNFFGALNTDHNSLNSLFFCFHAILNGATKLCIMHYSHVVIILFNAGYKSLYVLHILLEKGFTLSVFSVCSAF